MKSLVIHGPRDLRIEERPDPAPGPGQLRLRLAVGGICGSDLHYFNHGGFGSVRLREPMILGHEVSAWVEGVGAGVTNFHEGQLVAVSPSRPCGRCDFCAEGLPNHCMNMRFYGSAMPFPHIQGAFSETLIADPAQCVDASGLTPAEAALAEPLAVVVHAMGRAGQILGRRVLVLGCGPIGLLAILVARRAGAAEIVALDISDFTLGVANRLGADRVINTARDQHALDGFREGKGHFDLLCECSGVAAALSAAIPCLRPRGIILQLGLGGDMDLPLMTITTRELELRGAFRFHGEFATAVDLMRRGLIDVKSLITRTLPLEHAVEAFRVAGDRATSIKTHIAFSDAPSL